MDNSQAEEAPSASNVDRHRRGGYHLQFSKLPLLAFSAALLAVSAPAATITYTLTQDGCTGTCGTSPFGTITLTDTGVGSTTVTVTETLKAGERFAGTGAGDALEFNVDKAITISNISAGFAVGPAPDTASTFGTFLYSISCTSCSGGNAGNPTGPLTFTVTNSGGLTINDFIANAGGYFFSSDIVGTNGNTGNVAALAGANSGGSPTPEPGTLLLSLTGMGLVGLGWTRKRING